MLISETAEGLNPKYSLKYDRLADALFRASVLSIKHTSYTDMIHEKYVDEKADEIPMSLYLKESVDGTQLTVRSKMAISAIPAVYTVDSPGFCRHGVRQWLQHAPVSASECWHRP